MLQNKLSKMQLRTKGEKYMMVPSSLAFVFRSLYLSLHQGVLNSISTWSICFNVLTLQELSHTLTIKI